MYWANQIYHCDWQYLLNRENKRRENLTPEQFEQESQGTDLCDKVRKVIASSLLC
jgi:hypothetical protein